MMHWNEMSSRWHEDYARGRPSYPVDAVRVADLAPSSAVLEVGAGTGKLTRVLVALAVVAGFAAAISSTTISSRSTSATASCGLERWTVKTLQDKPRLLRVHQATVHFLVTRPASAILPTKRLSFERRVYPVTSAVTLVRHEANDDLDLVLRVGADHMIADSVGVRSCDRAGDAQMQDLTPRATQRPSSENAYSLLLPLPLREYPDPQ